MVTWWKWGSGKEYCEAEGMDEAVAWRMWVCAAPVIAFGRESYGTREWPGSPSRPPEVEIDGVMDRIDDEEDLLDATYQRASFAVFMRDTMDHFYGGGDGDALDDEWLSDPYGGGLDGLCGGEWDD